MDGDRNEGEVCREKNIADVDEGGVALAQTGQPTLLTFFFSFCSDRHTIRC
jgi:hypothetical protein